MVTLRIRLLGENGKIENMGIYRFEDDVAERLSGDFVSYNTNYEPKAGTYKAKDVSVSDPPDVILSLRFDKIASIG